MMHESLIGFTDGLSELGITTIGGGKKKKKKGKKKKNIGGAVTEKSEISAVVAPGDISADAVQKNEDVSQQSSKRSTIKRKIRKVIIHQL
jgi:hypothetical protein